MKLSKYKLSLSGRDKLLYLQQISIAFLTVAIVYLGYIQSQQKAIVTLIPPGITEKGNILHNETTQNVKMAWARYMAYHLGNVSPSSGKFTEVAIGDLLSPSIYTEATKVLNKQIERMRRDKISISFESRRVLYEKESNKSFVHGFMIVALPTGNQKRQERTYEFEVEVINYMPTITHIDTYLGPPLTKEQIAKNANLEKSRSKNIKKKEKK